MVVTGATKEQLCLGKQVAYGGGRLVGAWCDKYINGSLDYMLSMAVLSTVIWLEPPQIDWGVVVRVTKQE